jgi:glycerol-3-phosphate dehydrogenase
MTRDLRRLADTRFDLLVVGAGFYGALAAWDATLRGLSVALIDQGDFGGGTSFNNFKTLHGGLRSLQAMNFAQMRLFIRERRALARVAPHLIRPLAFIVPTYAHPLRSRPTMQVALAMNDFVSRDRHAGVTDPALRLPPSRVVPRDECLRLNPLIDPAGVTGGAIWHDYQMHNTDRMTFSFVASAAGRGAVAANHLRATAILRRGTRVEGVGVEDRTSADAFDVRATTVLNATGAWASAFLSLLGTRATTPAPRLSRAMNLITRRLPVEQGCGGRARGRFLFVAPWRDVSIVGTSHDAHEGGADRLSVTSGDLDAFLSEVQEAFPRAHLTRADVRLVHRGLLPMVAGDQAHVQLLRESAIVDHHGDGADGLVSMFGVRYTTARDTAARAVDAICARLQRTAPPSATAITPVVGGDIDSRAALLRRAALCVNGSRPASTVERLARTYGSRFERVLEAIDDRDLATPLGAACAVTVGEVVYAARHEMAITLADALIRRTEAGSAGHPGADAVMRAAEVLAREHQWNRTRVADEITRVDAFYRLP